MFGLFKEECMHQWGVKVNELSRAPITVAHENGLTVTDSVNIMWFQEKHVYILACTKCGKLDKTIKTNTISMIHDVQSSSYRRNSTQHIR